MDRRYELVISAVNSVRVRAPGLLFAALMAASAPAFSGAGWSTSAVPTSIDVVRGEGFMIYGQFGNGGSCTFSDQVFIQANAPDYKALLATAMLAYSMGRQIMVYTDACVARAWYAPSTSTFNTGYQNITIKLM